MTIMRLLLKLLSAAAVAGIFYYLHNYYELRLIRNNSALFVHDSVNSIVTHWDMKDFNSFADPSATIGKDMPALFKRYMGLGRPGQSVTCAIQSYDRYKYPETNTYYLSATYECAAWFEKASATIFVTISRLTNSPEWRIRSFDLYSPYLSQLPMPTPTPTPKPTGLGHP